MGKDKDVKTDSFKNYLSSKNYRGFRIVLLITVVTFISTFIPENLAPLTYIRWFLGPIFVVFIPGYTITKNISLFKELDWAELVSLSVGLSLAILPPITFTSMLLSHGFKLEPILYGLFLVTSIFLLTFIILDFTEWKSNEKSKLGR